MKKKIGFKISAICIIAVAFTLGIACGANADRVLESINAQLNKSLKIMYNGVEQNFTDANGKPVYPISYGGSTYLPVRAMSKMLDETIEYDSVNYQVLVGKQQVTNKSLLDVVNSGYKSDIAKISEKSLLTFKGKTYSKGIQYLMKNFKSGGEVWYNVNGFNTFKATIAYQGLDELLKETAEEAGAEVYARIEIRDQNKEAIATLQINSGESVDKEIMLPSGTTQITFRIQIMGEYTANRVNQNHEFGYVFLYDPEVLNE